MIGALNPIAFIGTTEQSKARDQPWRRLVHTANLFETVFFGTREQADHALARTDRLHEHVRGKIQQGVGRYPAGTPYSAFDPELMLWVIVPMYDSAQVLFELLVGTLRDSERQRLWDEYVQFGELFGMPRGYAPRTIGELARWWQEQLASDHIFLTDYARAVGRSIATKLPLPLWARAPMRAGTHVLIGSLPPSVREQYRFRWTRTDELAFQALTAAHRAARPLIPTSIRSGSCRPHYATVARQERHNARLGKTGFDLPDELAALATSELDR
jgi:uncharacterized protein (DUF2236 family)